MLVCLYLLHCLSISTAFLLLPAAVTEPDPSPSILPKREWHCDLTEATPILHLMYPTARALTPCSEMFLPLPFVWKDSSLPQHFCAG